MPDQPVLQLQVQHSPGPANVEFRKLAENFFAMVLMTPQSATTTFWDSPSLTGMLNKGLEVVSGIHVPSPDAASKLLGPNGLRP